LKNARERTTYVLSGLIRDLGDCWCCLVEALHRIPYLLVAFGFTRLVLFKQYVVGRRCPRRGDGVSAGLGKRAVPPKAEVARVGVPVSCHNRRSSPGIIVISNKFGGDPEMVTISIRFGGEGFAVRPQRVALSLAPVIVLCSSSKC
jgi:hypothetical protein